MNCFAIKKFQPKKNIKRGADSRAPHVSGRRPSSHPPLLCSAPHARAMAGVAARHCGGGVLAGQRLAGGAAWPARGPGSPTGPAPAAAQQGMRAARLAAAQGQGNGGARPFRPGRRRRRGHTAG